MGEYYNGEDMTAMDRWDRLLKAMGAEPRRLIAVSLVDVPEERRLPLPNAATSATLAIDPEELAVQLHHHHLPLLEDAGYIKWEDDPFCVQRGPNFEEAEAFVRMVFSAADELPEKLIDGCAKLETITEKS